MVHLKVDCSGWMALHLAVAMAVRMARCLADLTGKTGTHLVAHSDLWVLPRDGSTGPPTDCR